MDWIDEKWGGVILGEENFSSEKHGHSKRNYGRWGILLDCRGDLNIDKTARFGYQVAVITASHLYDEKGMGRRFLRKIKIDAHAWVGTRALLYNCWIQEHAIVGAGAVVKNAVVPAWSLVEGNPAMQVGAWDAEKGRYVKWDHTEKLEKF